MRSVFAADLRLHRAAWIGWALAILAYTGLMVAVYPTIRDRAEDYNRIFDAYPPAFREAFGGGILDLASGAGYLQAEIFSTTGPLILILYAVGRGAGAIAGDEERGRFEWLLALPLARGRLLIEKTAGLALTTLALVALLVGVFAVVAYVGFLDVGLVNLAQAGVALFLLTFLHGAIALAAGAATGRRGLAIGAGAGVAVAGYLLQILGAFVDWLDRLRWLSPMHHYASDEALTGTWQPVHAAVFIGASVVVLAVAFWGFGRRDLRA